MSVTPTTRDAFDLLLQGSLTLARMEHHGLRVDTEYLSQALEDTSRRIGKLEAGLRKGEVWQVWEQTFGSAANLGSRPQLGKVLFDVLKHPAPGRTEQGRQWKTDDEALSSLGDPWLDKYLRCERLKKARGTYLEGLQREVVGGFVHPNFKLHSVDTFRSCVAEGTLIETVRDVSKHPKGIPIEQVRAGDYVYCYDDNLRLTVRKVLWAGKTGRRRVIRLHWSARGKHGYLDVTPEHRIRLVTGEYVQAQFLEGRDFRTKKQSKRAPKIQTLAMGRCGDLIYETGNAEAMHDHRLIYQTLIGPLKKTDVVHHKDNNHYNNTPSNLERMTKSQHASHHAPEFLTDEVRRMGVRKRIENHRKFGDRWPSGPESPTYIKVSRFQMLRRLARAKGRPSKAGMDFVTLKNKASALSINWRVINDRYDRHGKYISLGRLRSQFGGKVVHIVKAFGLNHQKAMRMLDQRGIPYLPLGPCHNPHGRRGNPVPNNHKITKVEWINEYADVYDIEVEEFHNFIANEICVHNSCSDPNVQNQIVRNEELAAVIRRCYVPRPGHWFYEVDYGSLEFRGAACFWQDPAMVRYASDFELDIHRDMAARLYRLAKNKVSKKARYCAKNMFVFPTLYGSDYINCARNLWEAISKHALENGDGLGLHAHLANLGITRLGQLDRQREPEPGTLEEHVRGVERWFMGKFSTFAQKRRDWWRQYQERGWFDLLTGFRLKGHYSKNFLMNSIVQGPSFHLMLWSLIQIDKELRRRKLKTRLVAEIHDSLLADGPPEEAQEFLDLCERVMTRDVRKHWGWVITPLTVEVDVADDSWAGKKPWVKKAGVWQPKEAA